MGADEFFTRAVGRTAGQAFADAVEDARYEHGHGGYTGTIAEKHSFVEIRCSGSVEAKRKLAEELLDSDDPRVSDKWGPAGCIKLRSLPDGMSEYLFFGWASS